MNLRDTNVTGYVFVPTNHGYSKVLDLEIDIFAESIPRFTDISLLQLVVKMIEVD